MSNSKEQRLFAEFPPVSTGQWEEVITADLKGADYQKKLVWKTDEGFNVRPYYRAEDLSSIGHLGTQIGQFPYVRGAKCGNDWLVHQTVDASSSVEQANKIALKALAGGTESLGFMVNNDQIEEADLDTLLNGIDIARTELVFCGHAALKVGRMMIAKARSMKLKPEEARFSFLFDPIINKLSLKGTLGCTPDGSKAFGKIRDMVVEAGEYDRMKFAGLNGQKFHNCGATIVQELAFTLAAGHEYVVKLMEAGLTVDQAASTIRFSMAVSSNYFMEIAKFRAARMLWANIVEQYKPRSECSTKLKIHAITSQWNITAYDPYVNMLRGTTEAMSATIAGVHSLEVTPFNAAYESPTDFSSRIARNVQLLLKHESHFNHVTDPAGGSYYLETLTKSIAEQAWILFREVEAKGGYIAAFKEGFIQDTIEASAARKNKNIATRREILLGSNQYPNFTEKAVPEITESTVSPASPKCGCGCKSNAEAQRYRTLQPYRGSMAFEQLRLRVDRSGRAPKAFMLTCGTLSMARARAQFASNFFACAGIQPIDNTFFASVAEGAEAALKAGAEIVVICSADDDYATLAPEAAKLLGGKAILVVAGAPASQPELETQGITNFISVRSNVLETLTGYVNQLGI